jgi:hypothetical protein
MSILSVLLLLSSSPPQSVPVCPLFITDHQVAESPVRPVSIRYGKGRRYLNGIDVYIGHPDNRRAIRGDDWTSKDRVTYGFNGRADVWMECQYFNSAAVLLFHPGKVKECTYTRRVDVLGGGRVSCSR